MTRISGVWFTLLVFVSASLLAGCSTSDPSRSRADTGGIDAGEDIEFDAPDGYIPGDDVVVDPDADPIDPDADPDHPDADPDHPDADPNLPDAGNDHTLPSAPATVLRVGVAKGGMLLRGIVLAPDRVIDPGEVLFKGTTIVCVAADCTGHPDANDATWINTNGVISPGLIDGHNHLGYNFLPQWFPNPYRFFNNRYQWADEAAYEDHVRPYAKRRSTGSHYCPAGKWGELRSLIHATTTMQGQSFQQACVNWGIRNADHYHGLGHNHMATAIGSVRDITTAQAENYISRFEAEVNPVTRFAVHMTEGLADNNVLLEFDSFAGRDERTNVARHQGLSLLNHTSILIHSMVMTDAQLDETQMSNAKIVWSPSSQMVLYGTTSPIERILNAEIVTGIGPDWTVSGEPDMLAELRFARSWAETENVGILTSKRLWQMATSDGAIVVGLEAHLGRLEPGFRADIAVFGRRGDDPYAAVVDSRTQDVRLVFVDGKGMYGDANLMQSAAVNEYCEDFDACGKPKFICVQESPGATARKDEKLDDIRTQLFNILEGIGYPTEGCDAPNAPTCVNSSECDNSLRCIANKCVAQTCEQYKRGDELLELAICDN
ncbi:MAG: amidohydrolase family protein [Bradymonadaceae bacterium]|nr:amidohydrolase family protein [Lujinxingiaceae bacterium]